MSVFLFLKQIIDVFYAYRFGDYCMAVGAVILILIQLWFNRPDQGEKIKIKLLVPDVCIIILSGILGINFIIQLTKECSFHVFYTYGKIGSAVLLYMLGRLCYKRIDECAGAIILSSYIIVYSNLIYRIINLKESFFTSYAPLGDLYFYDTDMSFSILMSMIFIAVLGRNTIIKFITIFAVCPFMVIHSEANVQKLLMIILFGILFIYMGERAVKQRRYTDYILPIIIIIFMGILIMLISPVFTGNTDGVLLRFLNDRFIGTENMLTRYSAWSKLWSEFGLSGLDQMLIGNGIVSPFQLENAYLSLFYSTGIIGTLAAGVFILSIAGAATHIEDRPTYYVTIMLAVLFLGTCMNKNCMEFTQMSWFTMLYFGMGAAMSGRQQI